MAKNQKSQLSLESGTRYQSKVPLFVEIYKLHHNTV